MKNIWSFDIETMPISPPEEMSRKRLAKIGEFDIVKTVNSLKKGTKDERAMIMSYWNSGDINVEALPMIRSEVINEFKEKEEKYKSLVKAAKFGDALDKRFSKVICISVYTFENELQTFKGELEHNILEVFEGFCCNYLEMPTCRSWNGERFDFPTLIFRCYVNGLINAARNLENLARAHKDLFWIFNNKYERDNWINLSDACEIMAVPHALRDNLNFEELWQSNNLQPIYDKCEHDTLSTYHLAAKFEPIEDF